MSYEELKPRQLCIGHKLRQDYMKKKAVAYETSSSVPCSMTDEVSVNNVTKFIRMMFRSVVF